MIRRIWNTFLAYLSCLTLTLSILLNQLEQQPSALIVPVLAQQQAQQQVQPCQSLTHHLWKRWEMSIDQVKSIKDNMCFLRTACVLKFVSSCILFCYSTPKLKISVEKFFKLIQRIWRKNSCPSGEFFKPGRVGDFFKFCGNIRPCNTLIKEFGLSPAQLLYHRQL